MGLSLPRLHAPKLLRPGVGEPVSEDDASYVRWYRLFHYAFGAFAIIAIVTALADGEADLWRRIAGSITALALVGWYWLRGQWQNLHTDRDAAIYFSVGLVAFAFMLRMHDNFGLIIFAAYWQGFAFLRTSIALIWAAILTLVIQWAYGSLTLSTVTELNVTPFGVIALLLMLLVSGMMAMYMESIVREGDRRQVLREAQAALARQEREAGMRQERQRLAAEIHDTIAQHFTSIVTNLEAAESRAETNPDASLQHLSSAKTAARLGITDARRMVHALQPDILTGKSLRQALREIAGRFDESSTSHVVFVESGEAGEVDRLREAILVRALQEALTNARKHAHADNVEVTLTWLDDEVILDVQDDGAGFSPERISLRDDGHHMGLTTMRARVESAGGTLSLESAPNEGSSLAVSFPMQHGVQEHPDDE